MDASLVLPSRAACLSSARSLLCGTPYQVRWLANHAAPLPTIHLESHARSSRSEQGVHRSRLAALGWSCGWLDVERETMILRSRAAGRGLRARLLHRTHDRGPDDVPPRPRRPGGLRRHVVRAALFGWVLLGTGLVTQPHAEVQFAPLPTSCPPGIQSYPGAHVANPSGVVCVPRGDAAFAQSVFRYTPGQFPTPATCRTTDTPPYPSDIVGKDQNGTASGTLGPTSVSDPTIHASLRVNADTSLGVGGVVVLRFGIPLSGSGNSDPDVWVWEVGMTAEPYEVAVSADGVNFTTVGTANTAFNGSAGYDIDDNGFTKSDRLFYVRITDTQTPTPATLVNCTAGSDIDAVAILSSPSIALTKSAKPATGLHAGDVVTYSFAVTNVGADPLINLVVQDPLPGLSAIACPPLAPALAPGQAVTCTATRTITTADATAGIVTNTATARATPQPGGPEVSATSTATVTVLPPAAAAIRLVKTASPRQFVRLGETVTYSFAVTNTGGQALINVVINDPLPGLGPITCPAVPVFAVGQSITCTAPYTATAADVTAGRINNTATVTANPQGGGTAVSSTSSAVVTTLNQTPDIELVKTASPDSGLRVGDVVTYTFTLENTGRQALGPPVLTDPLPGMGPITCSALTPEMDIGETRICTAQYTVKQADVDAGSVHNTATVVAQPDLGGPPVSATSSAVITTIAAAPGIGLVKTASPNRGVRVGDVVTYSFAVQNTGTQTLINLVVSDPLPGLSAVTCPPVPQFAVGQSITCTARYTVKAADLVAGSIRNTATAVAQPLPGGPAVSATSAAIVTTIATTQLPDLTITKSHSGTFVRGQTGSFTVTVTNVGGEPSAGAVSVADTVPQGMTVTALVGDGWTCTVSTLSCTRSDALASGSSYRPITVTVRIATNAPLGPATNTVVVSGGNDSNQGNNQASDSVDVVDPVIPPTPVPVMPLPLILAVLLLLLGMGARSIRARGQLR